MSFNIYDGFKIDLSLPRTLDYLKTCTETIYPEIKTRLQTVMADRLLHLLAYIICVPNIDAMREMTDSAVVWEIDRQRLSKGLFMTNPRLWIREQVRIAATKSEMAVYNDDVDSSVYTDLKVTVFPYFDKTLGIVYGPSELKKAFLKLSDIEDCSYWECTEKPNEVSECEWGFRRRMWKAVLPSMIPSKDGFSYTLFSAQSPKFPGLETDALEVMYHEQRESILQRIVLERYYDKFIAPSSDRKMVIERMLDSWREIFEKPDEPNTYNKMREGAKQIYADVETMLPSTYGALERKAKEIMKKGEKK